MFVDSPWLERYYAPGCIRQALVTGDALRLGFVFVSFGGSYTSCTGWHGHDIKIADTSAYCNISGLLGAERGWPSHAPVAAPLCGVFVAISRSVRKTDEPEIPSILQTPGCLGQITKQMSDTGREQVRERLHGCCVRAGLGDMTLLRKAGCG